MEKCYSRVERASSGHMRKLKEFMVNSDNRICADCNAQDPKWASVNIGVFICLKCADIHRNLGEDISKVLSVIVDEWSEDDVDYMIEVGGNSYANSIYEAYIPNGYSKPKSNATHQERSQFIRSKYESQEFLEPSLRMCSKSSSFKSDGSRKSTDFRSNSNNSNKSVEDMGVIGDLKVMILKGKNLAIRDMFSSDPYVVLTLGQQKAQTAVIASNLNPVWNEELTLAVPVSYGNLKLQVYDQDVFSSDDIMGDAEIDLQPMITSATAFGNPELLGNMQIGKWLKTHDNPLIKDSIVKIIEGKIKQDVQLKLQNVESGEVELQLEWIPQDP